MPFLKQNPTTKNDHLDKQWKSIYIFGGVTALMVILGTILDIIIGTSLGGGLSGIPKTAIGRFAQFQDNKLLGLYTLDLLNLCTTMLMIPTYFALWSAHRKVNIAQTTLALIIYYIGATVFITNNAALAMLDLSNKYAASTTEVQKTLLAAAGEALLARGAHGSLGVFLGFLLLSIGSIVMSLAMLKGKVFGKPTAYMGISGSTLLMMYVILVTFVPETQNVAMMVAAPGGILALAWMIMLTIRLFQLGHTRPPG